jgi:superfamily II DNA or RNA helicase
MIDFSKLDGSGREPRPQQNQVLDFLKDNWDKSRIFSLKVPTGAGKSFIARTIQRATGGLIITPDNILIKQYIKEYPELNVFAGKNNYITRTQYNNALTRAIEGVNTVTNPIAYFNLTKDFEYKPPKCIILDEADQHISLLYNLVGF